VTFSDLLLMSFEVKRPPCIADAKSHYFFLSTESHLFSYCGLAFVLAGTGKTSAGSLL